MRNTICLAACCAALGLAATLATGGCGCDPRRAAHSAATRARRYQTPAAYEAALRAAAKMQDLDLAVELALECATLSAAPSSDLAALRAGILWTGGQLAASRAALAEVRELPGHTSARHVVVPAAFAAGDVDFAALALDALDPADLSRSLIREAFAVHVLRDDLPRLSAILQKAPVAAGQDRSLVDPLKALTRAAGTTRLLDITEYGTAEFTANSFWLPQCLALLNGRGPYRLIIDSGAGAQLFLSPRAREDLGLEICGVSAGGGFGGQTDFQLAALELLEIGTITCRGIPTVVMPDNAPLLNFVDGMVGTGVFQRGRVTLELAGGSLRVEISDAAPASGVEVPIWVASLGHVLAEARVAGQRVTALLDTGAGPSVVSRRWFQKSFPGRAIQSSPFPVVGVGPAAQQQTSSAVGSLEFAGRTLPHQAALVTDDLDAQFSRLLGVQVDWLMGMLTFAQMQSFTIDYPARRAWFDWSE